MAIGSEKPVDHHDQDVADATDLGLVHHLEPELGPLGLLDLQPDILLLALAGGDALPNEQPLLKAASAWKPPFHKTANRTTCGPAKYVAFRQMRRSGKLGGAVISFFRIGNLRDIGADDAAACPSTRAGALPRRRQRALATTSIFPLARR